MVTTQLTASAANKYTSKADPMTVSVTMLTANTDRYIQK